MKKAFSLLIVLVLVFAFFPAPAHAANTAKHGQITGKHAVAGIVSLLVWPGIGQYMNDNETKKNWTHAVIGLFPPFRLWSGWDALIGRTGGRWDGKI